MEFVLETKNLTKTYRGCKAVDNVNLHVKKGDIYGFIGQNGAGKTTLMRMVAGLARPTSGELTLFSGGSLHEGRRRIGCMIEYPALYPGLSALDNLEVYRRVLGIPQKDAGEKALALVGLTDTGKKSAKQFSLGMRQRLGLAIALLGNPDFLILDEPTNGLDPAGIIEMRDLIHKLNQENGITILISSHILGELAKVATCYGIIKNGALVDEFSEKELNDRCKRCLKITVDNPQLAAQVVESKLGTENYDVLPGGVLRLFDHVEDGGLVNSTLMNNGVGISAMQVGGQDLEGYFMELMGGMQHA